jgi:hypothetical protein
MAKQEQFIQHELQSLSHSITATEGVLSGLTISVNNGSLPPETMEAIRSIRLFLANMSKSVDNIQRILADTEQD